MQPLIIVLYAVYCGTLSPSSCAVTGTLNKVQEGFGEIAKFRVNIEKVSVSAVTCKPCKSLCGFLIQ